LKKIVAQEEWRLFQRDYRKYATAIGGRYLFNLLVPLNPKIGTMLRATNSYLRIIDDIVDLDRSPPDEKTRLEFVNEMRQFVASPSESGTLII